MMECPTCRRQVMIDEPDLHAEDCTYLADLAYCRADAAAQLRNRKPQSAIHPGSVDVTIWPEDFDRCP